MPCVTTYKRTGPMLEFLPLWFWVEEHLGRKIDRINNLHALFPFVTYETMLRWNHKGMRLKTGRQIATHFGVTPTDIWTDWPKGYEQ